jgi:hypothetical protein
LLAILAAVTLAGAASLGGGCSCSVSGDDDGAGAGASTNAGAGGEFVGAGGGAATCDVPCESGLVCSHGVCVPSTDCGDDNDCSNDTTCVGGKCVPWQEQDPAHDPDCVYLTAAGTLIPKVRCEFIAAPADDAFPAHLDVQATPVVVNFNGFEHPPDSDPIPVGTPSIAATFTATVPGGYTEDLGVIRILSGKDCSLEANLGGVDLDADGVVDWIRSSSSLAAGDLDGDGKAEIVAYAANYTPLAFKRTGTTWSLLWKASSGGAVYQPPIAGPWAGPSIHDIDDDGVPEVLVEGAVLSGLDGVLRAPAPGSYASYSSGLFTVTADLDQDAAVEFTNGQYIWEWTNGSWVQESYFPGASPSAPGHVALADFGPYGMAPAENAELAVIRSDTALIYAISGEIVQQVAIPGGGGGPPTVADFDGDGLPELAVAGQAYYTIFDIDCGPTPRQGGSCPAGVCDFQSPCPPGIAWSKSTQDISSNITGSSVFDFEADGVSEAVYADECFVRVYNGTSGEVIFSQYHSSCTWYENPIVADVDGNYRADLVMPSNKACSPEGTGIACEGLTADGVDAQFAGLRCETPADCISGVCDAGLCRCTSSAQCCGAADDAACIEVGFQCAPPPTGTAGAGNTCRAAHPHGLSGIRVYSDENDKWVRSRMIWNQHAYAVTHVEEDGTIPQSSAWKKNWEQAELNNFRANVPGSKGGTQTPDFTAGASNSYVCGSGTVTLSAPVCNRGAAPAGAGIQVGFYVNELIVCTATTTKALQPEQCEVVSCVWDSPPVTESEAVDVTVKANSDGALTECKEGNNAGVVLDVYCKPTG